MPPNLEILRRLNDFGVPYVLIGGMAAVAHGSLLVTRDVDVCISFDSANLERLVDALRGINPRLRMRPDLMPLPDPLPKQLNNLYLQTDLGVVDFLSEVTGVGSYAEAAPHTIRLEMAENLFCQVLDLDTLIRAKRAVGREKDHRAAAELELIRERRSGKQP